MKLRPIEDRIIVKCDAVEDKTKAGIFIPEAARSQAQKTGVVVATGPGRFEHGTRVPMAIKVGDHVLLGKRAISEEVLHDGAKCLMLREADVMGVIEGA